MTKRELVSSKYLMPIIEQIISDNKQVEIRVSGNSMKPLLLDRKSLVRLKKVDVIKKNDIVLYKNNKQYILHRIIKVHDGYFTVSGDNNNCNREYVKKEDIIGVVTSFNRLGKCWKKKDRLYHIYLFINKIKTKIKL